MPLEPGAKLGRYVLERRLATGGMGDAFLAKQEGPAGFSKRVVVKVMHAHYARDPQMVEMFLAEARLAAQLNHASIVQIFDVSEAHDAARAPWIAMEYVDGLTLLTATRRCWGLGHGIPIDIAVRVIAGAAQGLAHAHAHKIIHRDISPDNIMCGKDGAVKLLDFGIAKIHGSERTQGEVKGKIPYMAPEQLDPRAALDGRCDLYALGVTLYWCLAGRRPYVGEVDVQLIRAIVEDTPTPLRELNAEVSPALEAVVMNLLEKKAVKREGDGDRLATRLLATVPPTQENPIGPFIAGLRRHDGNAPEQFVVSAGTNPGVPAVTVRRAQILLEKAPAPVQLGNETKPTHPGSGELRAKEDAPSTTHAPRAPQGRSRAPLLAAIGAIALIAIIAVIVANTADDGGTRVTKPVLEERARKHLVVRDTHASDPQPHTEADDEDEQEDEPDDVVAQPDSSSSRSSRRATKTSESTSESRTVSLIAPADVRWTTVDGKAVGRGSQKVTLAGNVKTLIAVEPQRAGKHTMSVASRMDFYALPRGQLDVRVVGPAKRIKLGGDVLGSPPLRPVSVAAGSYTVVVETTGKTLSRPVKVKGGQTTVITVDMNDAK